MKKIKKRSISFVLTLVMLFSMCSAVAVSAEEPVEITLWTFHSFDETTEPDSLGGFWKNVGEEYVAATGANVKVTVESIPNPGYMDEKLPTAFATGSGPDVFLMCPPIMMQYVQSDLLVPLNDYYTDEMKEDFYVNVVDGYTVDGNIYSFPFNMGMEVLFVNMDALEEAGQEVPTNWEELRTVAAALTTEERWGLVTNVDNNTNMPMCFSPFVWMQGDFFTEDRRGSMMNSEAVTDALQLWRDLITDGSMPVKVPASGYDIETMLNGGAAMMVSGIWNIPSIIADESGMNIEIFPLPAPEGGKPASCTGGWSLAVADNGDPAKIQACIDFAKWLSFDNSEAAYKASTYEGLLPVRNSISERAQEEYFVGEHWDMVFSQGIIESSIPELRCPPAVNEIIRNMVVNCLADTSRPVEEFAAEADEQLKLFLETYDGEL